MAAMSMAVSMDLTNTFLGTSTHPRRATFIRMQVRYAKSWSLRRQRLSISNSADTDSGASTSNVPGTSTEEEASAVAESETSSSMSAPRPFSSLITASNIRKGLEGIEVVSVDHYAQLGIPRGCSFDQVRDAFKSKYADLMQQELDEEKVQSKLQDLKESYEILSSEEERRFYDWILARAENQDRYVWPYEVDITQRSSAPGPPKEEDDPTPTIYTGYFFLAWFLLAVVLSFTLK